jgi:hypothetical protein
MGDIGCGSGLRRAGDRPLIGVALERWKRRRAAGDAELAARLAVPIESLARLAAEPWPESNGELRQICRTHEVDAMRLEDVLWQAISGRDPRLDDR